MVATHSVTLDGVAGRAVEVEVDISSGLPKTIVVGLADTVVNEARDRVRAAVVNSGTTWPDQRVTINLAPSSVPKSGSHHDLSRGILDIVMRAAIYCRISADRTGAGLGVERQEADCRELADRLSWDIVDVFTDNDISAYSGKPRPAYTRMLEAIRGGSVEGVIAWHPDRLHRRAVELEEFVAVCEEHSTAVQTVRAGSVDLSTAGGRMVARMLGAAAQHEVDHARERMKRAKAQAAAEGRWRGGPRPFGYEADGVTVRTDEAAMLLEAARGVIAGRSLASLAREMAEKGAKGSRGSDFNGSRLRRILQRPRNAGLLEVDGEIVGRGTWPAIIPEDIWRAANAVLADPSRKTTPGPERRWLGSGLFRCGTCDLPLRVTKSNGIPTYRCHNSHVTRAQEAVDSYVEAHVRELLARPDVADALARQEDVDMRPDMGDLERLRSRLSGFEADYAAGDITGRQLKEATARISAEVEQVEARISAKSRSGVLATLRKGSDPVAAYENAPLDTRRAIVADLLTVRIDPGKKGRPAGWRPGEPYTDLSTVHVMPGPGFRQ